MRLLYRFLIVAIFGIILIIFTNTKLFNDKKYTSEVQDIENNIIFLKNNKIIQLTGIYIPKAGEINYQENLVHNMSLLLKGKEIQYRIIEKKRKYKNGYPNNDLAIVYIKNDKESLNEKLLKDGMAFFDHGYYAGKNKYFKLEKEARRRRIGIWKGNPPTILYIGSRHWLTFHYPECPEIKKIKEKDKIYYYFLPEYPYAYNQPDFNCRYCRDIEKRFKRPLLFRLLERGMENKKVGDIVER